MKKKIYLPLLATSILPVTIIASCASTDNQYDQLKSDLDQHIKTLNWNSIKDHSQVDVKSIKTEDQLLEYFELENKNEQVYKYQFKKVESISNRPGKLRVFYQISNLSNPSVSAQFIKVLPGFKDDDGSDPDQEVNQDLQLINEAIKKATFSVKDNKKNPDQIQASELIWNEAKKYPEINIRFENLNPDINKGLLGFDAIFSLNKTEKKLVVLPTDTQAIKNLLVVNPAEKTIEQLWKEVGKILKPSALIDISQKEVTGLGWNPTNIKTMFSWNKEEVKKVFTGTQWQFDEKATETSNFGIYGLAEFDQFKIEPTKAILKFNFKATNRTNSQTSTQDFSVVMDGFKPPARGELDTKENKIIKLPEGAVSYKGQLYKRQGQPRITSNNDQDNINKMTWSQYRLEMMFQARFLLYQEFSDKNLEEVDYYTLQDEENGYLTVEAQGILNKDIELTHSLQFINIGVNNSNFRSQKYKKGDVVKMRFSSRWEPYYNSTATGHPSWKPVPTQPGGFTFSFTDEPTKINQTLKPMTKFSLSQWHFEWYLNDQNWVSEHQLVFYHATPFLFYSTYKSWDDLKND